MKTNINGTSKKVSLGRGATLYSKDKNEVRIIQNEDNDQILSDFIANMVDPAAIQTNNFITKANVAYIENKILSKAYGLAAEETIQVAVGDIDGTDQLSVSGDITGASYPDTVSIRLYGSAFGGSLSLPVSANQPEDLEHILNNFFEFNYYNLVASYNTVDGFLTISSTDNSYSLKGFQLLSYSKVDISTDVLAEQGNLRVIQFGAPLNDVQLLGDSTAETKPINDSSNAIATTEFVHNLVVGGMIYKGTFDASAGNYNAISDSKAGYMYYVTVGGVIGNIDWMPGDFLIVSQDGAAEVNKVDNTESSDIVRLDATQTLTHKTLTSPALTGTPTTPTAATSIKNTQVASTAFVHNVVDAIPVDAEPTSGSGSLVTSGGVYTAIANHADRTNNPHNVTKAQVGLGDVDNTADINKPISNATQTALNGKVDKVSTADRVYGTDSNGEQTTYDFDSFGHVDDVKVGNTSVVNNKIATLGTMAGKNANDYSTKAVADTLYADIAYENTIDNHIANTSNPHSVTKAQVGLGNVDNTADADKPVSTAMQTALDAKANSATSISGYGITDAYTKTEVDDLLSTKDSFPSQTGNAGKFLSTDGTDVSWENVDAFPEQSASTYNKMLISTPSGVAWAPVGIIRTWTDD